ncbi:ClpX ATPase regulatory subunit, partial [Vararia minispora EC-137]
LVRYLDEYVVGQDRAKKALSVAVYNHYNRVRTHATALDAQRELEYENKTHRPEQEEGNPITPAQLRPHPRRSPFPSIKHRLHLNLSLVEKSNVLVIGPTGSGKTLLVRTLARVLNVPFSVNDATSFTQAGYVGEDVDMCIHRLLQAANYDPVGAGMGIVYIDEIDKIARKSGGGMEGARDVGGEGVQQALLRMMEGAIVSVTAKSAGASGLSGASEGRSKPTRGVPKACDAAKPDAYEIDTSNILFVLSGAFEGLTKIIDNRVAKGSIGFTADLKPTSKEGNVAPSFFTSNQGHNILELVETADLHKYGFIPEFVSRLPVITTLAPLSPADLRRILTDVRGSLVSQYEALFKYSGVELRFTRRALREICAKAAQRGGGARGLRGIMEGLLLDAMYEVPGSDVRWVLIDEGVVLGKYPALYWHKCESEAWFARWDAEDAAGNMW